MKHSAQQRSHCHTHRSAPSVVVVEETLREEGEQTFLASGVRREAQGDAARYGVCGRRCEGVDDEEGTRVGATLAAATGSIAVVPRVGGVVGGVRGGRGNRGGVRVSLRGGGGRFARRIRRRRAGAGGRGIAAASGGGVVAGLGGRIRSSIAVGDLARGGRWRTRRASLRGSRLGVGGRRSRGRCEGESGVVVARTATVCGGNNDELRRLGSEAGGSGGRV